MNALVLTTNFRNADNWLEVFQRVMSQGGRCELISMPWSGDPSVVRVTELSASLPVRVSRSLDSLSTSGISEFELQMLLDDVCTDETDVLFLCDMQSYPSNAVLRLLASRPRRPMVIGLQHGMLQSWWLYNDGFCADYLLVFGERHVAEIDPCLRSRVLPVGLPKLDRLKEIPTHRDGYIAHVGQKFLRREMLDQPFSVLTRHTGLPVCHRDHPQYSEAAAAVILPANAGDNAGNSAGASSYGNFLASANWVLTGYSTGGIEALYLGKPVVLLPSFGLTAWAGYPGVARDLSVTEILAAKDRVKTYARAVERFLVETFGGLRFDHADRAWETVLQLLNRGVPQE